LGPLVFVLCPEWRGMPVSLMLSMFWLAPASALFSHAPGRQLPPAVTQAQTDLMESSSMFHRASSAGLSEEEKSVEHALATAVKSPAKVGKPEMILLADEELSCLPDVNRCPRGWEQRGLLCVATPSYTGACKPSAALFGMREEERLAFARYCQVDFHCQEDCPENLEEVCPSLWIEIGTNLCEAPRNYVGKCASRVRTDAMSNEDKLNFGLKCGARWPCAAPPAHVYTDVCPVGWALQYGHVCMAPHDYEGSCGRVFRMSGRSDSDKQKLEAYCAVSWPKKEKCVRDYAAPCPHGWRERIKNGKVECVGPAENPMLGGDGCSRVQTFSEKTPVEKQRFERNCGHRFPCRGEGRASAVKAWMADGPVA